MSAPPLKNLDAFHKHGHRGKLYKSDVIQISKTTKQIYVQLQFSFSAVYFSKKKIPLFIHTERLN